MTYRVKSKTRFAIFLAVVMILSVSCFNWVFGLTTEVRGATATEYMTIEVCDGDTLWDIANTYMDNCQDTRRAVYEIRSINNLGAQETLVPGQTLLIPVC